MDWSWVGPAIGAVGGYLNSRNNQPTQTTTNEPPAALQPLLGGVAQRGMEIGNMPFNPYPYNQVADFNPYQLGAMDMTAARAQNPWLLDQGQQSLSNFMSGANAQPGAVNPYVSNMDELASSLGADVGRAFSTTGFKSGSFGNSAVGEAAGRGIANAVGNLRYQGGEAQAGRNQAQQQFNSGQQFGATQMAPQMYAAGFQPAQQMMGIGNQMQQQGQNLINANYNQWQQAQQWPFQTYNAMLGAFGHNVGGTSMTTNPQSPYAGALGGAMFGNYLQNQWQQGQRPPPSQNSPGGSMAGGWGSGYGYGNQDLGQNF